MSIRYHCFTCFHMFESPGLMTTRWARRSYGKIKDAVRRLTLKYRKYLIKELLKGFWKPKNKIRILNKYHIILVLRMICNIVCQFVSKRLNYSSFLSFSFISFDIRIVSYCCITKNKNYKSVISEEMKRTLFKKKEKKREWNQPKNKHIYLGRWNLTDLYMHRVSILSCGILSLFLLTWYLK